MRSHRLGLVIGLSVASTVAVAGCSGGSEALPGQALFEANCASCHGVDARGSGPLAASLPVAPPNILDHLAHHTEDQLVRLIQDGIPPAMPPAPISADQIRLVIEYAWTLLPESSHAAMRATQDSVASGLLPPGMPPAPMDHSGH